MLYQLDPNDLQKARIDFGQSQRGSVTASASLREMIVVDAVGASVARRCVHRDGILRQRPLGTKGRGLNALVDDGRDVVDHRNFFMG
jgi:hypothetical protein